MRVTYVALAVSIMLRQLDRFRWAIPISKSGHVSWWAGGEQLEKLAADRRLVFGSSHVIQASSFTAQPAGSAGDAGNRLVLLLAIGVEASWKCLRTRALSSSATPFDDRVGLYGDSSSTRCRTSHSAPWDSRSPPVCEVADRRDRAGGWNC